jgi:hypothetical protein
MDWLIRPLTLSAVITATTACAMGVERFGRPISLDRLDRIEVGRSTRSEVLALLGPPVQDARPRESNGGALEEPSDRALFWEYRERYERFGTLILYTYFSQHTLSDTLMVVFDERDVVSGIALERETVP